MWRAQYADDSEKRCRHKHCPEQHCRRQLAPSDYESNRTKRSLNTATFQTRVILQRALPLRFPARVLLEFLFIIFVVVKRKGYLLSSVVTSKSDVITSYILQANVERPANHFKSCIKYLYVQTKSEICVDSWNISCSSWFLFSSLYDRVKNMWTTGPFYFKRQHVARKAIKAPQVNRCYGYIWAEAFFPAPIINILAPDIMCMYIL
jgi:hypothetical protein